MALHNLATVFAPNLLRKQDSNALGMVVDTPLINNCFNVLLRDYDYIFGVGAFSFFFFFFSSIIALLGAQHKPIDATLTHDGSAAVCCRALYDYKVTTFRILTAAYPQQGESDDELSFQTGNIIKLIYERTDGWWIGEFKVGNFGRFPATYVKKWSAKQSESFTKRQQFKIKEANIKKQLDQELNQMKQLNEEKERVLQEIDEMNLKKAMLEREFFVLKKVLGTCPEKPHRLREAPSLPAAAGGGGGDRGGGRPGGGKGEGRREKGQEKGYQEGEGQEGAEKGGGREEGGGEEGGQEKAPQPAAGRAWKARRWRSSPSRSRNSPRTARTTERRCRRSTRRRTSSSRAWRCCWVPCR